MLNAEMIENGDCLFSAKEIFKILFDDGKTSYEHWFKTICDVGYSADIDYIAIDDDYELRIYMVKEIYFLSNVNKCEFMEYIIKLEGLCNDEDIITYRALHLSAFINKRFNIIKNKI